MGVWMAGQNNAAPIIIKRKKVIAGGGHHGGAWKVAYADFVTAMMAFFLLMWLLGATTEKQRKGVADYFSPTIPISRDSSGGSDVLGGNSTFTDETQSQHGTGVAGGRTADEAAAADAAEQAQIEKALTAFGGESMTMEQALRHVVTKVTDEGLVIEIFDLEDVPLFDADTDNPTPITKDIAEMLAEVLQLSRNALAVNGHVKAYPMTLIVNPVWDLSAARAQRFRGLLEEAGMQPPRVQRISGYADRRPVTADPSVTRNNRIEVILLRSDR